MLDNCIHVFAPLFLPYEVALPSGVSGSRGFQYDHSGTSTPSKHQSGLDPDCISFHEGKQGPFFMNE